MTLDIVIVNWNTGKQLAACVESIALANCGNLRLSSVVVVDNASADGSVGNAACCSLRLRVIRNDENRGFARACNQGAKGSAADFLLFLNPDTVLTANALTGPTEFMGEPKNVKVGITGIQLVDGHGRVSPSCSRFPTTWRLLAEIFGIDRIYPSAAQRMLDWNHAESREVDQVMGAFILIRRDLFESLGGFDERFFLYFEDDDLCLRALQAGYDCLLEPQAQVLHIGGASSTPSWRTDFFKQFHFFRSRHLIIGKYLGKAAAWRYSAKTVLAAPLAVLLYTLLLRRKHALKWLAWGCSSWLRPFR